MSDKNVSITNLIKRHPNYDLQTVVQNRLPHPSKPNQHLIQVQAKITLFEFTDSNGNTGPARTLGIASGLAEGTSVAEAEDLAIVRAIENLGIGA